MNTPVYWISKQLPGKLALIPRPRGGDWLDDEMVSLRNSGIDVIVSLLTEEESAEFDLAQEAELSGTHGISFFSFPINDRETPVSREAALDLLKDLRQLLTIGKNIGIHCRQSIGRAALIAASVLVLSGESAEAAFQMVSAARGREVPETQEQERWVARLAQEEAQFSAQATTSSRK
jgi:protein-tyrosine phosphatase